MDTNNIWEQYWFILLYSLIFECIRDEQIDKLISHIPKNEWAKYSDAYKCSLIRYGNSRIETNNEWAIGIIVGLFIITGITQYIGLRGVALFLGALMFIMTTIILFFRSKENLKQRLFKFSKKDVTFLIILSVFPLVYKMAYSIGLEILDAVRVLTVWFTYWLFFKYIPLKACSAMVWLIEFSKRIALKEADKENAFRNFLRIVIVIILGACIEKVNKSINCTEIILNIWRNWILFLFGG